MYSLPIPVDSLHSYIFRGAVRTQALKFDAALVSVSFLNHKRQRIQRFLSRPVTGTHRNWQRIEILPIRPRKDVCFVVIGCHLVHVRRMDIRGQVWFDDLWLGQLPQLTLTSNYFTHFKDRSAPIEIASQVTGLDPSRTYRLQLQLVDSANTTIEQTTLPLGAVEPKSDSPSDQQPVVWRLPPQDYGFYRIRSILERDGLGILEKQTTFAVIDMPEDAGRKQGEFGWSIPRNPGTAAVAELPSIAAQSGINWLKFPVWQSVYSDNPELPGKISYLFERLNQKHITPIGLLNDPPHELRSKFARNWSGFSEIFTMPPTFWSPSLEPVIARYSSNVRHWQLGSETDLSFVGMDRLPQNLTAIKAEFDRIGRNTHIGLHWDWESELPTRSNLPHGFLSLSRNPALPPRELTKKLEASAGSGVPRWVLIHALPVSQHSAEKQGADLVKRMVAAKVGGAEAIFVGNVFDSDQGLLNPDGSPTQLYLPWRTAALVLQDAEYIGSFQLAGRSRNFAFARDGDVVLILWNNEPVTEEIYLGEEAVISDLWGRVTPVEKDESGLQQQIHVGNTPLIISHCSEPLARWRLAVRFENGRIRSEHGGHPETIHGKNTFPQGVSGSATLVVPQKREQEFERWEVDPRTWQFQVAAGEEFHLPTVLTLPPNASLGLEELWVDFDISADRRYRFRVFRPYQVGYGDITVEVSDRKLADGRLEIEQIITNNTEPVDVLNFRCDLFVPGSKRKKEFVIKLGRGSDRKLYYLPDADALKGTKLWLRAEEIGGRRVLNYRWRVGQNWETP